MRPGAGAYGAGGEDDEGVEGFCSFSLMRRNRRIKADILGPNAQSGRFPAMSAMARAPSPVEGGRSPEGGVNDEVFRRVVLRDFFIFAVCTNRIVQSSIKFP